MVNSYIIEIIKIVPSLILTLFTIYIYFYYRKYINKFVKNLFEKLSKSQIKTFNLWGTSFEFIDQSIKDFISPDKQDTEKSKETLAKDLYYFNSYSMLKRAEFIIHNQVHINALWIDDCELEIIQKRLLSQLGINIEYVESSEKALKKLKANKYDLILSDINRGNNNREGIDFLIKLVEIEKIVIPTIFYTSHYDPSEGNPPYAFGVADIPYNLLLLCLDILERNIKKPVQKTVHP